MILNIFLFFGDFEVRDKRYKKHSYKTNSAILNIKSSSCPEYFNFEIKTVLINNSTNGPWKIDCCKLNQDSRQEIIIT